MPLKLSKFVLVSVPLLRFYDKCPLSPLFLGSSLLDAEYSIFSSSYVYFLADSALNGVSWWLFVVFICLKLHFSLSFIIICKFYPLLYPHFLILHKIKVIHWKLHWRIHVKKTIFKSSGPFKKTTFFITLMFYFSCCSFDWKCLFWSLKFSLFLLNTFSDSTSLSFTNLGLIISLLIQQKGLYLCPSSLTIVR